jgi:hypothetical protein
MSAPLEPVAVQQQGGGVAGGGTASSAELELYAHALINRMAEVTQDFPPELATELQQVMVQQVRLGRLTTDAIDGLNFFSWV